MKSFIPRWVREQAIIQRSLMELYADTQPDKYQARVSVSGNEQLIE
jgi:hypothetical protein